ncbi:DUF6542 domain-containing protein [Geodermatophilus sp. SYSU D00691]
MAADAWRQGDVRADRRSRPVRADRAAVADRYAYDEPEYARPQRRPAEADRGPGRPARRPAPETGRRTRGIVAVLGVFLVTVAVAAAESLLWTGLGLITATGLVVATAAGAFLVRRRDLLTVVVSPPLVFAAVVAVNLLAASSVQLSGVKAFVLVMGTQLVQNFPAMVAATIAGIVVALIRLAAGR